MLQVAVVMVTTLDGAVKARKKEVKERKVPRGREMPNLCSEHAGPAVTNLWEIINVS